MAVQPKQPNDKTWRLAVIAELIFVTDGLGLGFSAFAEFRVNWSSNMLHAALIASHLKLVALPSWNPKYHELQSEANRKENSSWKMQICYSSADYGFDSFS